MQFIDLQAQYKRIEHDIRQKIDAVLAHGQFIMGPEVKELEHQLANFCGAKHCITCASGTDALVMPLMAWNIGPDDAVFVPPFSFFATGEAPAMFGATPVMVDIDPATFTIDPAALAKAVEAVQKQDNAIYPLPKAALKRPLRPRVVIPVDLFGQPANYDAIFAVAQEHGLLVLEDAAQGFGGEYKGKKTCGLGCHVSATSFFPAKPLGCFGDGGALFTDDDTLADILRSIRVHGKGADKYDNVRIGMNGRLDTMQAAILLPKLAIFPDEIATRQQVAAWYGQKLAHVAGITLPTVHPTCLSVWAQYTVRVANGKREALAAGLKAKGIPANVYYPTPMHMLAAFAPLGYAPEDMPCALAASRCVLSLPFHPYMQEADVAKVASALAEVLA